MQPDLPEHLEQDAWKVATLGDLSLMKHSIILAVVNLVSEHELC